MACGNCRGALVNQYFQANGILVCERCIGGLQQWMNGTGTSAGRFFKAVLFGLGAALLGALGYGLWMGTTNSEFALVTIAIGWLVGKAVRRGSGNRGGWRYGLLAVVLTYLAISLSFLGVGISQMRSEGPSATSATGIAKKANEAVGASTSSSGTKAETASLETPAAAKAGQPSGFLVAVLTLAAFAISMPVLSASESILSLVITGFGLWQAWSVNRAVKLQVTGPHPVGGTLPA
jgi:hypothetical protein